jgi:WhiB family redox-sensing transcriptional regulator
VVKGEAVNWTRDAACGGQTKEWFFSFDSSEIEVAKAICTTCRARAECLEYAIDTKQEYGVWGGYTTEERRKLGRRLSRRVSIRIIKE